MAKVSGIAGRGNVNGEKIVEGENVQRGDYLIGG